MSIKIGDTTIEKLYLGSTEIEKIYQGDTAIYEGDEPTPPTPTPQYRWVNIDPNEQVDCVLREPEETEVDTPSNPNQGGGGLVVDDDLIIEYNYDAYYLQKKQVSLDGGTTWTDVDPLETQRGELYEENSSLCGTGGDTGGECYTIQSNGNQLGDEIWSGDGTQLYGYVNDDEGVYYDADGNPYPQEDYMLDIAEWLSEVVGVDCQSNLGGI
jgi:hypothetical protein